MNPKTNKDFSDIRDAYWSFHDSRTEEYRKSVEEKREHLRDEVSAYIFNEVKAICELANDPANGEVYAPQVPQLLEVLMNVTNMYVM